jgi:hypothetical protein
MTNIFAQVLATFFFQILDMANFDSQPIRPLLLCPDVFKQRKQAEVCSGEPPNKNYTYLKAT